jgi:hypothetical protein
MSVRSPTPIRFPNRLAASSTVTAGSDPDGFAMLADRCPVFRIDNIGENRPEPTTT